MSLWRAHGFAGTLRIRHKACLYLYRASQALHLSIRNLTPCSSGSLEARGLSVPFSTSLRTVSRGGVFLPVNVDDRVWVKLPFKWDFSRLARKFCTRHISGWEFLETRKKSFQPRLGQSFPCRTVSQLIKAAASGVGNGGELGWPPEGQWSQRCHRVTCY